MTLVSTLEIAFKGQKCTLEFRASHARTRTKFSRLPPTALGLSHSLRQRFHTLHQRSSCQTPPRFADVYNTRCLLVLLIVALCNMRFAGLNCSSSPVRLQGPLLTPNFNVCTPIPTVAHMQISLPCYSVCFIARPRAHDAESYIPSILFKLFSTTGAAEPTGQTSCVYAAHYWHGP
jgi:hypothetical protein